MAKLLPDFLKDTSVNNDTKINVQTASEISEAVFSLYSYNYYFRQKRNNAVLPCLKIIPICRSRFALLQQRGERQARIQLFRAAQVCNE